MEQKLGILNSILLEANRADNLNILLENVLDLTLELLNFNGGGIYLIEELTKSARIAFSKGFPKKFIEYADYLKVDTFPYSSVLLDGEPIFIEKYHDFNPEGSEKWNISSVASLPLFSKNIIIGALNLAAHEHHAFTAEEKALLLAIGRELGTAINRLKIEEALQNSRSNLHSLYESIQDMVSVSDLNGNLLNVNPVVLKRLEYTEEEIYTLNILDIHPPDRAEDLRITTDQILKGEKDVCNIPFITKNGNLIQVETKVVKGKWGNQEVFFGISRDTTERKMAEIKLKESEVRYRDAYEQARLYKDILAHDMQNILQNVKSSKELLSLSINNLKPQTKQEYLDIIEQQVNRGKELIANVQKLFQLEESDVMLKKVDAYIILEKATQFLRNSHPKKNLSIEISAPRKPVLVMANDFLTDIFENLLNNAVTYCTELEVKVKIKISEARKEGNQYFKFEFRDNGIGINDQMKKIIFQKGYTAEKRSKGMGLGLSLVKKIIGRYNGNVWVEDKVKGDYSKGSNFILLIPKANEG